MKRKIRKYIMPREEIARWYETIKPIVFIRGIPVYMKNLTPKDLIGYSYIMLANEKDHENKVDFNQLSILADVKMIHKYNNQRLFQPSVADVIAQIPKHLLSRTVGFNIVYSPRTSEDLKIFKDEFNEGYHVSVIRLYGEYGETNRKASLSEARMYPLPDIETKRMSEEESTKLKALLERRN